jgi:hypothetical protein
MLGQPIGRNGRKTRDMSRRADEATTARYKGQRSATMNERNFPHIVEIVVPPGGLGKTLDATYDFHSRNRIQAKRGQGAIYKRPEFQSLVLW